MQQLGASFINSFLTPYIRNTILGNIENDTRLQNMFRYDKVLNTEEINELEDTYFKNTGTVLQDDPELRKVFWKEFYEFVNRQKKLCNGNVLKLTFRLLPDAKTGTFSKEAQQNLEKFAFYAVSGLEDELVKREINQKEILGKISTAQASDDKSDLKEGKMVLVRQKDGKFDYLSDETIASAIGNTERTAQMLADLYTEQTPQGETRIYAMNPTEDGEGAEVSSSLHGVQELLWEKQSMQAEKEQLENNGIYVEAHMTVDANGIAGGFAQDKNGIRLRVEFDVKKPGERVYRITFADNPDNKFFISENELKQKFGRENQSAHEIFRDKEREAGRYYGIVKPRGSRMPGDKSDIRLPEDRKIRMPGTGPSGVAGRQDAVFVPPYVPNITRTSVSTKETQAETERQIDFSVMAAKRAFEERARKTGPQSAEAETTTSFRGDKDKDMNRGKSKASGKGKEKSFMWQVAKIYGAGAGGALGLGGIFSLLT